jgi:hypothetical protein
MLLGVLVYYAFPVLFHYLLESNEIALFPFQQDVHQPALRGEGIAEFLDK